jgi:serine/threonine protein kinase/Flp pilus assembly protein TadD
MSIVDTNNKNDTVELAVDAPTLPPSLLHYEIRGQIDTSLSSSAFNLYQAWDSVLRRQVLIKVMSSLGANLEAMLNEARVVASLKHSSFFKIHALEQDGDSLFIVMEAVQGTPLREWIKNHRGNEKHIIEYVYHLAAALHEAQAVGLVHGDLQSANLLIDQSGKIRILHFALRQDRHVGELQQLKQFQQVDAYQGIAYLAPERFSDVEPSPSSEVFALGVITYEMLSGELPFANLNGLALVAAQVQSQSEQWTWSSSISLKAKELILGMTKRDSVKRMSYLEVMQACQEMRPDDPISVSAVSLQLNALQAQLDGMARQRRKKMALILALVVVISGIGIWQAKPYWPQIAKALKPYSESREMEQGIAALERYGQVPNPEMLEKSSEHFERVLDRSPNNATAVAYMSLVYMSRYNNDKRDEIWMQKAKASAQQALRLDPKSAIGQIANAKVLQWHHRLQEALVATENALRVEPNSIICWTNKARVLLEMGRFVELHTFAEEGIKRFQEDRILPELNGVALEALGDPIGAENAYRMSIGRQPDSVNGYSQLANLLNEQGRFDEAMQLLQQGLQIRPNAQLYSAFGKLMFRKKNYSEAADAFGKAVSPQRGVFGSYYRWFEYGEALMWVPGREKDAAEAFRNAKKLLEIRLARSPDDAFIMSHMAFIEARLGAFDSAKKTLAQAIELDGRLATTYLYGAAVFELAGDRGAALKMIARAKNLQIPSAEIDTNPIFDPLRKDDRYHP